MSETLKPIDYGLFDVKLIRCRPCNCRTCGDLFDSTRWGGIRLCPDCDILRMKKINDSMEALSDPKGKKDE